MKRSWHGKKYRELKRNEIIKKDTLHSWCDGILMPVRNPDTIGNKPSSFSIYRRFYTSVK